MLEEGDHQAGLSGQVDAEPRTHPFENELQHAGVAVFGNAEHQEQRNPQTNQRLPHEFFAGGHAFRVFADHFAPVVGPANGAKTEGDDEHEPDKTVAEFKPQEGGKSD